MPPKTERVELRLDEETIAQIDAWRQEQDDIPTRSEAVRRLIDAGLESGTQEGFRLRRPERLTLWMLAEILKNQYRTSAEIKHHSSDTADFVQEVIYGGHYWAFDWKLVGLMHDEVDDPKKVRTVVNILDTWSFIERAYENFSAKDRKYLEEKLGYRGKDPKFLGFDGNNEIQYMGIAQFLVEKMGRFEAFKGRDFNSHLPTVARYTKMADRFESIRPKLAGRGLTPDEAVDLLKLD